MAKKKNEYNQETIEIAEKVSYYTFYAIWVFILGAIWITPIRWRLFFTGILCGVVSIIFYTTAKAMKEENQSQ